MPAPSCTDEEFIEAWDKLKSAVAVSKALHISTRSVMARRRRLETVYGIALNSATFKNKNSPSDKHAERMSQLAEIRQSKYHKDMHKTLTDGVILVASDCHYWPGVVTIAHQAFCAMAKKLKPKMVILNGDILDGARISRHARIMWEKQPDLKDEIHAVQDRCAEIERAAAGAAFVRTIGNHDARFENYLSSRVGEFEEMTGMTLLDYLPRWQAGWALHLNANTDGWATVRHRPVSGGIHSAYNSTLRAGVHYVHGHLHKLQITPWADYRGRRYGVDTGTMADPYGPQFNYTEAGPVNWASGFAVLTFHEGRLLEPELCVVQNGQAWFRGEKVM
jgi:hypothetical protein